MPRDSGGNYSLPSSYLAVTGQTIQPSQHNPPLEDMASALTASLPRDGSAGMTGPLKAADGSASNPSITFGTGTNTGFFKKGSGAVGLAVAGTEIALAVPTGVIVPYGGLVNPAGWLRCDGSAVSRSTYADLFSALTITANATKDGTATLNSVDTDLTIYGIVGAFIEGTGITNGTTISAVTASTITLSAIPSGTGAIAIRVLPHGYGDGSTTFNVPNGKGRVFAGREDTATLLTSAGSGVDGSKLGTSGGAQNKTIAQANLPNVDFSVNIPAGQGAHTHPPGSGTAFLDNGAGGFSLGTSGSQPATAAAQTGSSTLPAMSGTAASGGNGTALGVVQPTLIVNYIIKT